MDTQQNPFRTSWWLKKPLTSLGILVLATLGAGAVTHAAGYLPFSPLEKLSSSKLNDNFEYLINRMNNIKTSYYSKEFTIPAASASGPSYLNADSPGCPGKTIQTGGGCNANNGYINSKVELIVSYPSINGVGWRCQYKNDGSTSVPIVALVYCLDIGL